MRRRPFLALPLLAAIPTPALAIPFEHLPWRERYNLYSEWYSNKPGVQEYVDAHIDGTLKLLDAWDYETERAKDRTFESKVFCYFLFGEVILDEQGQLLFPWEVDDPSTQATYVARKYTTTSVRGSSILVPFEQGLREDKDRDINIENRPPRDPRRPRCYIREALIDEACRLSVDDLKTLRRGPYLSLGTICERLTIFVAYHPGARILPAQGPSGPLLGWHLFLENDPYKYSTTQLYTEEQLVRCTKSKTVRDLFLSDEGRAELGRVAQDTGERRQAYLLSQHPGITAKQLHGMYRKEEYELRCLLRQDPLYREEDNRRHLGRR